MPRPLSLVRRLSSDQLEHELDHLTTGDVLQRLAVLSPAKVKAIDQLARIALIDETAILHD